MIVRSTTAYVFAIACSLVVGVACDDDSEQPGTVGGPCYPNETCNAGLICDATKHCRAEADGSLRDASVTGDGSLHDASIAGDGLLRDASVTGDGSLHDATTARDGLLHDAGADSATPGQLRITYTSSRSEVSRAPYSWAAMGLSPLSVSSNGGDYLLILSAPDTWTNAAGAGAAFRMLVDDVAVAGAYYTAGASGQRVPVTAVGVTSLPAGSHTIKAEWLGPGGGPTAYLGASFPRWLIALPAGAGLRASHSSGSEISHGPREWTAMDLTPLSVSSNGGDYLLILSAPDTWTNAAGAGASFRVLVDDVAVAGAYYTAGASGQRESITAVGMTHLAAGSHTIKAEWYGPGDGHTAYLGASFSRWLIALPAGAGLRASHSGNTEVAHSPREWTAMDLTPLSVSSSGGDHLLLLSAPDTWTDAAGAGAAFRMLVDDVALAGAYYTAGASGQRVPVTAFGVTSLAAGSHTIKAEWYGPGDGHTAYLGASFPRWSLSFGR